MSEPGIQDIVYSKNVVEFVTVANEYCSTMESAARFSPKENLEKLRQGMHRNATKILLLAKLSVGFAVPALIAAGLTRLAWRRWFPIVLVGELLWTTVLMLIGYYATGAIIQQVNRGVPYLIIGFLILFAIMLSWFIRRAMRQEEQLGKLATDEDRQG